MRRVCIDTHALVWHVSRPSRLGRSARRVLRDVDAGRVSVVVPAIVGIELALLRESRRNVIGVAQLEALFVAQPAFELLPLDAAQVREFALLEALRDPFDRMIVAAARATATPLLSADADVRDSALVDVVWD